MIQTSKLFPLRLRRPIYLRIALATAAVATGAMPLVAQSASAGRSHSRLVRNAELAAARAANFEEAVAAAAVGNLAQVQAVLARDVFQPRDTLEFEAEMAAKLSHVAFSLRARGLHESARLVSSQALITLDGIKQQQLAAAPAQRRAQVWQARGTIQELLLVDRSAAKASYRRAQQEDSSAPGARAGLERIDRDEKQAAQVIPTKG